MLHTVYIPDDLYLELAKRAATNDTLEDVIRSLLEFSTGAPTSPADVQSPPAYLPAVRRKNPTVAEWKEHIEIVLGYREGETHIGTPGWTVNIHDSLCRGEAAFGATSTTAGEAMLQVIKEYSPDKYDSAIRGLRATILEGRAKGGKLKKVAQMWERISGQKLEN